jgi:hypothetical protein
MRKMTGVFEEGVKASASQDNGERIISVVSKNVPKHRLGAPWCAPTMNTKGCNMKL